VKKRPNIIVLITHDTGKYVSPYGISTVDTPNCERLAAESVVFENSFCTAPQCSPSRAGLVTGRFPHANGVMGLTHGDFGWSLDKDEKPAAMLFGANGYETWLLGAQHETHDPHTLGFSKVDLGFNILDLPEHLEPVLSDRDQSKPFYCQIGCFETHRPFDQDNTPPDDSKGIHVPAYLNDGPETRKELAQFQGLVKRFDEGLGRLLDLLEKHQLVDNTILVVTTDHGIAMPMAKGTLYDPGIETMLFVRYPDGGWPANTRLKTLTSNVDILPTLLETAEIGIPENIHGKSLLPVLHGEYDEIHDQIFAEKTFHGCYDPMRCVRTHEYKYIRYFEKSSIHRVPADIIDGGASRELGFKLSRKGDEELFDLGNDPHERNNLAENPEYKEQRDTFRSQMALWMKETSDPLLDGPIASPHYYKSKRELSGA